MKTYDTIPAEAERPCDCCKRIHRKLHYTNGFWLGESCEQDYSRYLHGDRDIKSAYWKGYEKKFIKVQRMAGG